MKLESLIINSIYHQFESDMKTLYQRLWPFKSTLSISRMNRNILFPWRYFTSISSNDKKYTNDFFRWIRRQKYNEIEDYHYDSVVKWLENKERASISRMVTLIESLNHDHRLTADEIFRRLFIKYKQKHDNESLDKQLPTFRIGIWGAPGSGKSSLIEKIGMDLIHK